MSGVRSRVDEKDPPWWRQAVIHQLHPRSLAGGEGDDGLLGATARLEPLSRLGVDAVWVNRPVSGTTAGDPSAFVDAADRLGLRVLLDMVATHCSPEHRWFTEALAAPPGSPSRRRFWFRDGRGADKDRPPNDWVAASGRPAWSRVVESDGRPGQWYLHLVAPPQPDLCWDHPEVRSELSAVIRSWFDRGVDGLRVDAAAALGSPLVSAPVGPGNGPLWDIEGVHDVLREWRAIADSYDEPRLLVGDTHLDTDLAPDIAAPWQAPALRHVVDARLAELAAVGGPPAWLLSTHDETPKHTRYGSQARDRAATLVVLALPGCVVLEQDDGSMLSLYTDALALRRTHPGFDADSMSWGQSGADALVFTRGWGLRCLANFGERPLPLAGRLLLASGPLSDGRVPADTAVWVDDA